VAPACAAPCSIVSSPSGWALMAAVGPIVFTCTGTTIAAGAQTTLILNGPFSAGTFASMPVHGSGTAQSITVLLGTASAQTSSLP
jgi:hypothetical protein